METGMIPIDKRVLVLASIFSAREVQLKEVPGALWKKFNELDYQGWARGVCFWDPDRRRYTTFVISTSRNVLAPDMFVCGWISQPAERAGSMPLVIETFGDEEMPDIVSRLTNALEPIRKREIEDRLLSRWLLLSFVVGMVTSMLFVRLSPYPATGLIPVLQFALLTLGLTFAGGWGMVRIRTKRLRQQDYVLATVAELHAAYAT